MRFLMCDHDCLMIGSKGYDIFKSAVYRLYKLLWREAYLRAYPAAAYVEKRKFLCRSMDYGHELFLHSDRSAASANIACDLGYVIYVEQLDGLLFYTFGSFLEIELLCNRQQKAVISSGSSMRDKGLECLIKRLTEHFRDVNPVYEIRALIGLNCIFYFVFVKESHGISF